MRMASQKVDTIIDGSTDRTTIRQAIDSYLDGLSSLAFPPQLQEALNMDIPINTLKDIFLSRSAQVATETEQIIYYINERAQLFHSKEYIQLVKKDRDLWLPDNQAEPLFGALACVDKGVSAEALLGPNVASLGRVLAGDIEFSYIASKYAFCPNASALIKRFIHYGRQGNAVLIEPLVEHTSCGRRGQILANEGIQSRIPTMNFIFEHIEALASACIGDTQSITKRLSAIRTFWLQLPRQGPSVVTKDAGLYVGVIQKIAQRQALQQLKEDITVIAPIDVYEKETGNLYMGLDRIENLTDPLVFSNGGYTHEILTTLADTGRIFSLAHEAGSLFAHLHKKGASKPGRFTYHDLQKQWLPVMQEHHAVTALLWHLYDGHDPIVSSVIQRYFRAWNDTSPTSSAVDRRITHHIFHAVSYAYVLNTLAINHEPGIHHIEQYLATGDHEIGTKPRIALGQGDLDRPDATEIYTGYSVLLHSSPGKLGTPIPVTIKLDTDRNGQEPLSTEETNVAIDDLKEFFRLWPYFLVGDIIPILMVRGKVIGGVSRLGLSVLRCFGDMATLYEQSKTVLPRFVPATNSRNEVVLVPAKNVLMEGIAAGKNLTAFRKRVVTLADQYADAAIQNSFASSNT